MHVSTRKLDHIDTYHGVRVPDPYRWLEVDTAERAAWLEAQNAVTTDYLTRIPIRARLRARFEELLDYPRYYDLQRRGSYLIYKHNAGLQGQLVLCGREGRRGASKVLVDPMAVTGDDTCQLTAATLSHNGRYLVYGLSTHGSDWQEYFVREMRTGLTLPDHLQWIRFSQIAWRGDGFYYSRPSGTSRASAAMDDLRHHQLWYHRIGTSQSADTLVYEDADHPLRMCSAQVTGDERFVVLTVLELAAGKPGTAIWVLDTARSTHDFTPVVSSFDSRFWLVDSHQGGLMLMTDRHAPNRRVVLLQPERCREGQWRDIIPEQDDPLVEVTMAGDKLFAIHGVDAIHRLHVLDSSGGVMHEVPLPGLGRAHVFPGQREDRDALWSYTGFTSPPTIYCYDFGARTSAVYLRPAPRFTPADYHTEQVFYRSKDGTRVPMFIVHRKGFTRDGTSASLLYGYGGHGVALGPAFDPLLVALLERGLVFAVACLRGGGEYGETWHLAGWRENKQHTFDDCISAAEWLQDHGYTSRKRAALIGVSNGGLLVGAVMVQRPELFQVAIPIAGVLDMLRFHCFAAGYNAAAEYGTSDDPAMFPVLLAYSPLHNLRSGVAYPATLITTYQRDESVAAAHSYKFAAALQEKKKGPNPCLLKVDRHSGHGAASLPRELDERADIYAFILAHVGAIDDPPAE